MYLYLPAESSDGPSSRLAAVKHWSALQRKPLGGCPPPIPIMTGFTVAVL